MDTQDREIYARVVDVVVALTAAVNRLSTDVDQLTTAVSSLAMEVSRLERRGGHDSAE